MKILVFVEKFMSPTLLFIYNEIQELSKTNDVLLVTTKHIKETAKDYPFEPMKVIPFTPGKVATKTNWLLEKNDIYFTRKNHSFSKSLNSLVKTFKPDVIHSHFGYESIILLDNLSDYNGPVFITFHGYDASEMLKRKSYIKKLNTLFGKFNVIPLYVSDETRKDLVNAGINMSNGRLLYCGVNTSYLIPSSNHKNSDKYTFLQISSFIEKKGHIYTLQAFKKFLESVADKSRYRLILAGGGPLLEKIKKETTNLGLNSYVEFTGFITHPEIYPLLQQADVFVHHSIIASKGEKEGIPTTIMEAMAMELPVISTWHAGIPELVIDGVNGYLVKEKDIDAYAQRMKDILTWNHLPASRQKAQDLFSSEVHNKNLLDIYNNAISSFT